MNGASPVERLIEKWESARAAGHDVTAEELCAGNPDLLEEVKRHIAARQDDRHLQTTYALATPPSGSTASGDTVVSGALSIEQQFTGLRLHAKGGLGAIYVATDVHLHRNVALKFILERHADVDVARQQFLAEAEITSRLEHPGVVAVYGLGLDMQQRPFYAMRFVDGESLEAAICRFHQQDERRPAFDTLAFKGLVQRLIAVCNTIAYSHSRGIIHRDIKPDNIMLGKYGETLVLDWGLAIPVKRDAKARASGEATLVPSGDSGSGDSSGRGAGTPAFMSPEQADGNSELTPATDIFSLGATLYKLLTGEPPYKGDHPLTVMRLARTGEFIKPSRRKSGIPAALEAVCLKAMAINPGERYATALGLAEELERWLGDEPVQAYPEQRRDRAARWLRKHRTWAVSGFGALAVVFVIATLSAIVLGGMHSREREARGQAIQLCARFAAKSIANEMDARWRVLELEARNPALLELLEQNQAKPNDLAQTRRRLKSWLDDRFIKYQSAHSSGWFILDDKGRMVALTGKYGDVAYKYLGKDLSNRDFFHGQLRDYPEGEGKGLPPIEDVHCSTVYMSRMDKRLKVAFSVPIRTMSDPPKTLGVLVMSVDLGQFRGLESQLGENQIAAIVDTRPDYLGDMPARGLILHHRRLLEDQIANVPPEDSLYREDDAMLQRMDRLRGARLRLLELEIENRGNLQKFSTLGFDSQYRDPVGGDYAGRWLAAFEPVIVDGRSDRVKDTGWIVVVQERN